MARNTVIVSITANTKGLTKGLGQSTSALQKFGGVAKGVTKIIAGIGGAVVGLAAAGGFARALKMDEAQTQLKALGYSSDEVIGIMDSALASVEGTAFGLDAAATIAANALASGVKPGEDLTRSLTTVANTAALAGVDMGDMGAIFQKVWANGKVTTQEMNQLADRGVPIWQYLSEAFGVSNDELRDMISNGEVTAEMFEGALGPAVEGMAEEMGSSFKGMLANAQAALSRIGALFAGPVLEAGKGLLGVLTDLADSLASKLSPYAEQFGEVLSGIDWEAVVASIGNLVNKAYTLVTTFSPALILLEALKPVLPQLAEAAGILADALGNGLSAVMPSLVTLVGALAQVLAAVIPPLTSLITWVAEATANIINFVVANSDWLTALGIVAGVIGGVIAAVTLFKAVQLALVASTYGVQGAMLVAGTAAKVYGGIMKAQTIATNIAAGAQRAFNVVMSMNPIGLIITAITALVAGLVWFFTQTELGQEIWAKFTQFLGEAWDNVVAWVTGVIDGLVSFFSDAWNNISNGITSAWDAIVSFFTGIWDGIKDIFNNALQFVLDLFFNWHPLGIIISKWDAIMAFLGKIPGWVGDVFSNAVDWLKMAGIKILIGLYNGITGWWENVVSWFTGLPDKIGGFFSGVGSWLLNVGEDLIRGLGEGIANMGQWVLDQIGGVIDGAIGWAKGLLGISSPSKVFAGFGKDVVQGLAQGLTKNNGIVDKAMGGLSGRVEGGFSADLAANPLGVTGGAMAGAGGSGNVYNVYLDTLNATAETGRVIVEAIRDYEKFGGRL